LWQKRRSLTAGPERPDLIISFNERKPGSKLLPVSL